MKDLFKAMKDDVAFLPQSTLVSVDDFVSSQMQAVPIAARKQNGHPTTPKQVPKFTVDGYGRWRQIRQADDDWFETAREIRHDSRYDLYKSVSNRIKAEEEEISFTVMGSKRTQSLSPSRVSNYTPIRSSERFRPLTNESYESYKHISTSLRSNVFPGMGKGTWESSSKREHVSKVIPPSWQEETDRYGVKKDAYMKWAEHDVYRQRLMKAWDKYISEAPKIERQVFERIPKEDKKSKEKEAKKKPKAKKETKNPRQVEVNVSEPDKKDIQPMRIEVKPAKSDDEFWDFYEKPFPQS